MMDRKIAIVTGAAKGIGKAIARQLTDMNCFVILVDVDEKTGTEAEKELGKENAKFMACDISQEKKVAALFQSVINDFNKVDILVNNAGILRDNMIWKMPSEDFDSVIQVNLKGTWLMCKEAATIMRQQKNGRIVNIASRAWLGNRGQSNYSASKAGIVGLTRVLALELGKYNIYVNAVAPGLIDTPLTQALPENVKQKLIDAQPTKKMGKSQDVANVVAFLIADKTQFITGQTIYVDGGKSIGAGL
ncbi:MAG: SDR family oxidoreductase [Bacteroidetes bacterium]|nr:SDR family oxidoreductase [Bacteroidota bacterium]